MIGPRWGPLRSAGSGPLSRPILHVGRSPQATQTFGLCALGLRLVKAAGLVQTSGLPARFSASSYQHFTRPTPACPPTIRRPHASHPTAFGLPLGVLMQALHPTAFGLPAYLSASSCLPPDRLRSARPIFDCLLTCNTGVFSMHFYKIFCSFVAFLFYLLYFCRELMSFCVSLPYRFHLRYNQTVT